MLHTINKSPFTHQNLQSCLNLAKKDDPILLYEDAVLAIQQGSILESLIKEALGNHPIFALEEDVKARGITNSIEGVKLTNYAGFVDLVEQHKVTPWL